jgi:hypothetical protein
MIARRRRVATVCCALVTAAVVFAVQAAAGAGAARAQTVWLCRPGARADPCTPGLSTTIYSPSLIRLRVVHPIAVRRPPIDCFYVYPTVSDQPGPFANLDVDPEERSIALYQAARYSQYCDVYAPMYRQGTLPALERLGVKAAVRTQLGVPLRSVESAFADYLAHDNHGRGFVLIGHSQGSILLRRLIATKIDPNPVLRRRLVSAILLGGNVLVRAHSDVGGDFTHIPACRSAEQLRCVIAFSTFDAPVPSSSLFGFSPARGESVLCTNPAALAGGSGLLDPIFPRAPFAPGTLIAAGWGLLRLTQPMPATVWSSEPGAYSGRCSSAGGAEVLQITARDGAQTPQPSPDPAWGLHLLDAGIALGNLVTIVGRESGAYSLNTRRALSSR